MQMQLTFSLHKIQRRCRRVETIEETNRMGGGNRERERERDTPVTPILHTNKVITTQYVSGV